MALFKPEMKSSDSNKFMGICELGIVGFEDHSDKWDWADIYLKVTVKVKDSDYTRTIDICGGLERDSNGNVTGGSVLNRVYRLFEVMGCTAGINLKGKWETAEGESIKDIATFLSDSHLDVPFPEVDPDLSYVGYIYKQQAKNGNAYTICHYRLFPNTSTGAEELKSHVTWMKSNGHLKEASNVAPNKVKLATAGADAL